MEKKQTVIGVDPGKQGFITVMKSTGIKHYPMPKVGKELDLHELSELIIQISEECDINNTVVVIEDVHALPRSAAGATFTFGGQDILGSPHALPDILPHARCNYFSRYIYSFRPADRH